MSKFRASASAGGLPLREISGSFESPLQVGQLTLDACACGIAGDIGTVNKWAAGISDPLALGILCEAYGMGGPRPAAARIDSAGRKPWTSATRSRTAGRRTSWAAQVSAMRRLIAPSPHCPGSLPRLLQTLEAAGHGDAVTQLACAICGRAGRKLPRPTPQGRACDWCVSRTALWPCSRCGENGHIVTRSEEEGAICRSCYQNERRLTGPCADCGRHGTYRLRRREESLVALCRRCAGYPDRECVRCGTIRPVQANSPDGPLCSRCYTAPAKPCGKCGQLTQLAKRGKDGDPGVCHRCYTLKGVCTVCGRFRDGAHSKRADGAFLCDPCRPRPPRRCVDCGRNKKATVTTWPIGPLCSPCYSRRRRNPEPCSLCGVTRVLVGSSDGGGGTCGPCCGTDIDFSCRRCGTSGDILGDGCCVRCVVSDHVRNLLAGEDGQVAPALAPLAEALATAPRPRSVLEWLRRSPSARLLTTLAAGHAEITHALLDDLSQDAATRHVRDLLVHTQVLPKRQEYLNQLELWFRRTAQDLPAAHIEIIRFIAEWFVIRDARRRADRGRYSLNASSADRNEIRAAIEFMQWLDSQQIELTGLTQSHLDVWLAQAKLPTARERRLHQVDEQARPDPEPGCGSPGRPTCPPSPAR